MLVCKIQVFAFDYDQCVLCQLVELMEQEPYLVSVQVIWEIEYEIILKNLKNWDFICVT